MKDCSFTFASMSTNYLCRWWDLTIFWRNLRSVSKHRKKLSSNLWLSMTFHSRKHLGGQGWKNPTYHRNIHLNIAQMQILPCWILEVSRKISDEGLQLYTQAWMNINHLRPWWDLKICESPGPSKASHLCVGIIHHNNLDIDLPIQKMQNFQFYILQFYIKNSRTTALHTGLDGLINKVYFNNISFTLPWTNLCCILDIFSSSKDWLL